jgi:hypothetical protein
MAFNPSKFFLLHDVTSFGKLTNPRPRQWCYRTTDSIATLISLNYFNAAAGRLQAGDRILLDTVTSIDTAGETVQGVPDLVVKQITSGVVYVVLSGAAQFGYFNVLNNALRFDGSVETTKIQYVIDSATTNSSVLMPDIGYPYTTGPLLINALSGLRVQGSGVRGTQVNFTPTGNQSDVITAAADPGTCIQFATASGSALQFQCGIENLSISSSNLSFDKNGVRVVAGSSFYLNNVSINGMWGGPAGSCALRIMGHENSTVTNAKLQGSIPLRISQDPLQASLAHISLDHWAFRNLYLLGPTTDTTGVVGGKAVSFPSCIMLIDDNARVVNLNMDGDQAWVGGRDGLYCVAPTDPGDTQANWVFENVRKEGGYNTLNKVFRLDFTGNTNAVQSVIFKNCMTGEGNTTLWYLRNCGDMTMIGGGMYGGNGTFAPPVTLVAGNYVADVNTADSMEWVNVRTGSGNTNNLAGFSGGSPFNAATKTGWTLPSSAVWLK